MSRKGGDNHFISAREGDLKPLLEAGRAELDLDAAQGERLEAFLEAAWLAGTRSGHAKLLAEASRQRAEQSDEDPEAQVGPAQIEELKAEFKAIMEAAAETLNLPFSRTVSLWDILSRAWTAGVRTYESEVMASLIERGTDIIGEARSWLGDDG